MNKDKDLKWYTLRVYTGREDHVARTILDAAKSVGLEKKILEVLVPKQKQIEIKSGKKITKEKKILPGYVLVKMHLDNETMAFLTSLEEIRGFVRVGNYIVPLSEEEVTRFTQKVEDGKEPKFKVRFMVNDAVRIIDGIFKGQVGKVTEVDEEKGKVKVLISMLGTDIPYEINITEVEKL